jgi:Transposase
MEYGAIDLHKKESQIRIVTESGETLDRRIATTRDRFTAVFEGRRPMRILLEAIESEWVAQHLETLGHELIVADPTFAPMYSGRSRRIKTDRRDVAALAEACHRGCYRAAHRRSASQRTVQAHLNVRRELTDSGTRAISLARGDHARSRAPYSERQHRELPRPGGGAGPPVVDHRDARAAAARDRGPQRRARDRGRPVCKHRGPGPRRGPVDHRTRDWAHHRDGVCRRAR